MKPFTPTVLAAQCAFFGQEDEGLVLWPLHSCGNSLMCCKEKCIVSCQRLRISHLVINYMSRKNLMETSTSLLCGWGVALALCPEAQTIFRSYRSNPLPHHTFVLPTAIEPQKEEADENYNSVNTRMRKTQHGVLSQQFVELINKCNSMQSEYREKNVERIRRQLKITNAGMVSDEELEQMLDSGQSEVFVSNILKDTQVTRQALNEISARHSEIQQLERSIRELHEIFTFLATEVEMQGEMINRIEKNILSSADYVERGQEHVKMALENQKKARKKKVLIAICVSITVLILAVIICVSIFV
uniref:t-SNARE coiled-coil homology domain-containing protein n=1 Tax=Rhinolophus ferrumequinum TaxID=59479 RepID=A0A671G2W2_RHIFE